MCGKKKDNLSKDTIIYTIGNYFVKAVAIISAPIFTRLLPTDEYGKVTLYTTWLGLFGILTCLELKGTIVNAYAKYEKEEYKGYIKNCISISFISLLICEVLILLFPAGAEKIFKLPIILCFFCVIHSFFNGMIMYLSRYLSMTNKPVLYIAVSGIQAVLNVLLSVLFIYYLPFDRHISRITGQFLASFVVGMCIIVFFCHNKQRFLCKKYIQFAIPLAIPLLFHAISGIVLDSADKIMLGRLTTDSDVGIYGYSGSINALLSTLTVSFLTAWRTYAYNRLKANEKNELSRRMQSYIRCFTIACVSFMLVEPELVKLISDKSYWDCIPIVIPLSVGEYFYFLYTAAVSYELFHQKNIWTPVGSIGAAMVNILINLFILRKMGAMGAAISTLVSNALLWLFHDFIARKIVKGFYYPLKNYFLPLLGVIAAAAFAYCFIDNPIIRWPIAIALGGMFMVRMIKTRSLF